jgi:serine/threonine protein kinase
VAARNVLLDKNNVCKISDFGLCRAADNQLYVSRGGRLPFRWTAIESLKNFEYSEKTDVWSYGILLFELFSLGQLPYIGMENSHILEFLEEGKRLDKPAYCSDEMYEIMFSCWKEDPNERPTFIEICQRLMPMLEDTNAHYTYVDAVQNVEIEMEDSDLNGEVNV